MVILTDDQRDPQYQPTRENIIEGMLWLVEGARPNDSLFFHYSGHGSQSTDYDGDEVDGSDETICPVDYKEAGEIVDDEMNALLVQQLPRGARLTAIFDSCHSATALDLPTIKQVFKYESEYSDYHIYGWIILISNQIKPVETTVINKIILSKLLLLL